MAPLLIRGLRTLHLLLPAAAATAAFLLAAVSAAAQPAPAPPSPSGSRGSISQPDGNGVLLVKRPDEMILLLVRQFDDGSIGLILSSNAPRCRFSENVFELPIQVNETGFQLKHAIRAQQKRDGDGTCTESIATSYHPQHYWPLKTAAAVTLHLPGGLLPLNEAALAHLKTVTPARPAEILPVDGDKYITAINRLATMLSAGQARQAREAAEVLLPAFASRPPEEGFAFFATLGLARRMTGDLALAASSFEVATMLAAMTTDTPNVGIVYDNLATVRRMQKRWPEAEQASDRAMAALEAEDEPRARQALAGVYNNRALLMVEQEQYEAALAYSEKALAILKVTLKNDSKELEAFLEDNRKIRERLRPR
jgi:tetratricopeptide (TPR) repeat protein